MMKAASFLHHIDELFATTSTASDRITNVVNIKKRFGSLAAKHESEVGNKSKKVREISCCLLFLYYYKKRFGSLAAKCESELDNKSKSPPIYKTTNHLDFHKMVKKKSYDVSDSKISY